MVQDEIASLITSNIVTIVGAVYYVSTKVSAINNKLETMQNDLSEVRDELKQAREGRAKLHEKLQDLSERVTIQEVKSKSTRIGIDRVSK